MMLSSARLCATSHEVDRGPGIHRPDECGSESALVIAITGQNTQLAQVKQGISHQLHPGRVELVRDLADSPPEVTQEGVARPHQLGRPGPKLRVIGGRPCEPLHPVHCQCHWVHGGESTGSYPVPQG